MKCPARRDSLAPSDMDKWKFAARHGGTSFIGITRLLFCRPGFALTLFLRRLRYFLTRRFDEALLTPEGFLMDTPDMLIAYWSMFVERELHEANWVRALAGTEKPLVADVGANAGVFSLYAHTVNPRSEIIAFEPLPEMLRRIQSLKERTGMNLTCHDKAVSHSCGEAFFETAHGYDGTSRLSTSNQPAANTFRVETTTLDTIFGNRKIDVMKIDVEGFECDVIAGGKQALSNTRFLIIEAQTAEHLANITSALGTGWTRKKLGPSDFLFTRRA